MSQRRFSSSAIMVTLLLNAATSYAACVDFDGSGRCIGTGPVGNVPSPTGIERVGPAPSSPGRNTRQQEQSPVRKAPRPSGPSMKSVVTGTIVEGVVEGLFKVPSSKPARAPEKAVTSVTSPEAIEIQRQLEEQENRDFLRSKNDLAGGLKGVGAAYSPDDNLTTTGGIDLKAIPDPATGPDGGGESGFFGTPGAATPTVGLLREPMNGAGEGGLNPEDFKKAIRNPDLTQEERDRLLLRTQVAPSRLDDHPMVDSRAFVEKERYSDLYLDIASAGGKAAATTVSLSLVDEAGKRALKLKGVETGYDELLTLGKSAVDRPQTAAGKVVAIGDFALTKAPTWTVAADGAVNATGAMTRQAIVRYWAAKDTQQYYDPAPIKTAKEKWNTWYADQNDWTRAALDRVGAGEFR